MSMKLLRARSPRLPQPVAATSRPSPTGLDPDRAWADLTWGRIARKVRRTSGRIGATFPHVAKAPRYDDAPVHWWTNGFWPGLLWLVYREEHDMRIRELAERCERRLDAALAEYDHLHHDVGFMWSLSAVARYKLLGPEESRRRGLLAASVLASRFNLRGGFIRAWNEDAGWPGDKAGWAIVDCLMNLPLLYWASATLGDPRFQYVAMAHADTALEHFVRRDGSCRHIVVFNPATGAVEDVLAGQGHSPHSAWARGAAWALYGFALSHRYTGEARYLAAAQRVARFFLAHLPPAGVPPWDFRAPDAAEGPRDSSAGACAASGLLELARAVRGARARQYRQAAVRLLRALDRDCGRWDEAHEGLLAGATGDRPRNMNVGVSLIYGDYFFAEAVAKLRGHEEVFW